MFVRKIGIVFRTYRHVNRYSQIPAASFSLAVIPSLRSGQRLSEAKNLINTIN